MDMEHPSSGQHQQMSNNSVENMIACSNAQKDNKPKPQPEQALKCPRCDSSNTKFCYYNNHSLSQPRYFCKNCRRYWTKGGTLRNVPVGGGCRKNKKSSSSSSKRIQDQAFIPNPNPLIGLTPMLRSFDDNILCNLGMNPSNFGFLDALISGFLGTHNNNNSMQNLYYGFGNDENMGNGLGEMNNVPYDNSQEMSIATTQAVSMKQELCNAREQSENKVLWGFPWKLNGGGDTNMAETIDSERASWNNGFTSSWHGLVNSPLM